MKGQRPICQFISAVALTVLVLTLFSSTNHFDTLQEKIVSVYRLESNNNTEEVKPIVEVQSESIVVKENQTISECGCTRKFLWPPSSRDPATVPQTNVSSCSDEGTHYQTGQNVVTFSLHFPNKKDLNRRKLYNEGIQLNLERMRENYPGYSMRVYTDVALEGDYCEYVCNNSDLFWCDITRTPSLGDQSQMFMATWRFLVLGHPTVDIFLSRDLDSAITPREAAVVHDWLQLQLHEKKAIHMMRDKRGAHNVPILAGMWGGINSLLGEDAVTLRDQIVNLSRSMKKNKMLDQTILNKVIFYPRRNDIVAYDSYHCESWKKITMMRPFPTQRRDNVSDFVGNYNLGRKKYKELPKCPVECRPSYGQDWVYC